ncbi:MAG: alpha/beta hydrolase [Candidatus Velthaea sp.]|jgi:pimeloyl-ACP methyl ester carboxylesterase
MQTTIDGTKIAYDDVGNGPAIVLIHGFPLDRTIWNPQLEALRANARVIVPDLRGAGESARGADGPVLMEALASDLAGLLDTLGIERAIVVGHSIGSYVAFAFFRMYAERVAGFGLVAGHPAADTPDLLPLRDALAERLECGDITPAIEAYLPRYLDPAGAPVLTELLRAIMTRQDARGAAALVRGMKERVAAHDLLPDITVPATIVAGESDSWIAPDSLRAAAQQMGNAEFVRLPDVGHLPMLEAPQATTAALARLIERCR